MILSNNIHCTWQPLTVVWMPIWPWDLQCLAPEMLNKHLWNFSRNHDPSSLETRLIHLWITEMTPRIVAWILPCDLLCFHHWPWQDTIQGAGRPVSWGRNHTGCQGASVLVLILYLSASSFSESQLPQLEIMKWNYMVSKFLPCSKQHYFSIPKQN